MYSADKDSFHYSDERRIQNWETWTEYMFLSFTQSNFLSFEFSVYQINEKSVFLHSNYC